MKEQAVQKINKIGKISSVVALICKILVGVGIGALILAAIVCVVIPKESVQIVSTEKVEVAVDYSKFDSWMDEAEIKKQIEAGTEELLINGEEVVAEDVEIVGNRIRVTQENEQYVLDIHEMSGMLIVLALMLVLVMISLVFAGGLCKAFRDCQSPFEENVIKKMQHFAYSLIPWIVASSVIEGIGSKLMTGGQIITVSVDVGMILVVLVVFLLVYIFKYGAVLQQESDETL